VLKEGNGGGSTTAIGGAIRAMTEKPRERNDIILAVTSAARGATRRRRHYGVITLRNPGARIESNRARNRSPPARRKP